MIQWDVVFAWFKANQTLIGWMGILSLTMFVGTLIAIPLIVIALPRDFLIRKDEKIVRQVLNFWYAPYWLFKNIFGSLFIIAGIAMLILPGQGILTILIGLSLITFPGKQRLIRKVVGFQKVFLLINTLRKRFGRPPILMPDENGNHKNPFGR